MAGTKQKQKKGKRAGVNNSTKEGASIEQTPLPPLPWVKLELAIRKHSRKQPLDTLLIHGYSCLQWGLCDVLEETSRENAESLGDRLTVASVKPEAAAALVAWAYKLSELTDLLGEVLWWRTLEELQALCYSAIEQAPSSSWQRLLLGCEIGNALSARLPVLPSCHSLGRLARDAFVQWGADKAACMAAALKDQGQPLRLMLASLVRQNQILYSLAGDSMSEQHKEVGHALFAAAAVMLRKDGSQAGLPAVGVESADSKQIESTDSALWRAAATSFSAKGIHAAMLAVMKKGKKRRCLTDEAEFPEVYVHESDLPLIAWRPSWSSSHGRWWVDFTREPRIELGSGRATLLQGPWTTEFSVKGKIHKPLSRWEENCWFADDEAHFLELQRDFSGGVRLQRQVLHLLEDDLFVLSEAILAPGDEPVECVTRWSLAPDILAESETKTRELYLRDSKRIRAALLPLGLSEWRKGTSSGQLEIDRENHSIKLTMQGRGRLDCSMALDLDPKRMTAARTWRQLTVAESLRAVTRDVAVGYRIQSAVSQWIIYRSLASPANRSVMGKNLSIDYFAGRFDAAEGTFEDLVSIESDPETRATESSP
jgi:hypothetical protein